MRKLFYRSCSLGNVTGWCCAPSDNIRRKLYSWGFLLRKQDATIYLYLRHKMNTALKGSNRKNCSDFTGFDFVDISHVFIAKIALHLDNIARKSFCLDIAPCPEKAQMRPLIFRGKSITKEKILYCTKMYENVNTNIFIFSWPTMTIFKNVLIVKLFDIKLRLYRKYFSNSGEQFQKS